MWPSFQAFHGLIATRISAAMASNTVMLTIGTGRDNLLMAISIARQGLSVI